MSPMKLAAAFLLSAWVLAACGSGVVGTAENPRLNQERSGSIKAALEKLGGGVSNYRIGWFDLDEDGTQEAIVLMMGADWCGSGGCTLMVLKQNAASWELVSRIPTSRSPVVLLDGKTNGWRDIAVITQGGGDLSRKKTVLKFQKNGYVKHPEINAKDDYQIIIP